MRTAFTAAPTPLRPTTGSPRSPDRRPLYRHVPRTRPCEPCPRPARGPDDSRHDSTFARKRRRTVRAAPSSPSRSGRHSRLATKKPDLARYRRPPDKHPHSRALARQKAPGKHRARQLRTTREPPRRRARWRRQPERRRSGAHSGKAVTLSRRWSSMPESLALLRESVEAPVPQRRQGGEKGGNAHAFGAPAVAVTGLRPRTSGASATRRTTTGAQSGEPRRVSRNSPGKARHRAPHSAEFEHPLSPRDGRNSSRHHESTVPMTARNAPATRAGKRARAPCRIGPRHPSRPVDAPCSPGPRTPAERARRPAHFGASPPRRKEVAADDGVITESGHIGTWRGIPWAE